MLALLLTVAFPAVAPARDLSQIRRDAVSWGVRQIGTHEDGTSNCSRTINRWVGRMGLDVPPCRPWCGAFVHEAFKQAGVDLSARLIDPEKTYDDILAGRRGLRQIAKQDVRPGDIVLLAIRDGSRASHEEIVRTRPRNGRIRTIGGNVSHAVRAKTRGLGYIALAARVTG